MRHLSTILFTILSFPLFAQVETERDQCIDFTDLRSPLVVATTGRWFRPYYDTAVMDFGCHEMRSRHTVYTEDELDPRTDNLLHTVPSGEEESVRLGNWDIGGEMESLTYAFDCDTTDYAILMLKYAVVLQDRNLLEPHDYEQQPKFLMEILDENNQLIDPECAYGLFVASDSLDWNRASDYVLWKDWTTVGLDISPYHGQRIYIRFSTFDCTDGGCYGYAYFHLSCGRKVLTSSSCGPSSNGYVYTAPGGFQYKWFLSSNPEEILSTEQSVTIMEIDTSSILMCELFFLENENCSFILSALMGTAYPYADFYYTILETNDCYHKVQFHNRSEVSTNPTELHPTGLACQNAQWVFGNGEISDDYNPIVYLEIGRVYPVELISGMADFDCSDTIVQMLDFTNDYMIVERELTYCGDSYDWAGQIITESGSYERFFDNDESCDSLVTLHLTFSDFYNTLNVQTCQNYTWIGQEYTESGVYYHTFDLGAGCDSIVTLILEINDSFVFEETQSACDQYEWEGALYYVDGRYEKTYQNQHGCDSIRVLDLSIHHHQIVQDQFVSCEPYVWHGELLEESGLYTRTYSDQYGCDSTVELYFFMRDTMQIENIHGTQTLYIGEANSGTYHYYVDSVPGLTYEWELSNPNWRLFPDGRRCTVLALQKGSAMLKVSADGNCGEVSTSIPLYCYYYDLDEADEQKISITPNPTNGKVTVALESNAEGMDISVYNSQGVLIDHFVSDSPTFDYSLEGLPKGIYLFLVEMGEKRMCRKVVYR